MPSYNFLFDCDFYFTTIIIYFSFVSGKLKIEKYFFLFQNIILIYELIVFYCDCYFLL